MNGFSAFSNLESVAKKDRREEQKKFTVPPHAKAENVAIPAANIGCVTIARLLVVWLFTHVV